MFQCPTFEPVDGFSEAQLSWFRNLRPVHCCPLGAGSLRNAFNFCHESIWNHKWKRIFGFKKHRDGWHVQFFWILEFNFWTSLRHEMSTCVFDTYSWTFPFPQPCTRQPHKFLLRCYPFHRVHPVNNKAASNFFQEWDRKHSALLTFNSFPSHGAVTSAVTSWHLVVVHQQTGSKAMGAALCFPLEVAVLLGNHWVQAAVSVPSDQPGDVATWQNFIANGSTW